MQLIDKSQLQVELKTAKSPTTKPQGKSYLPTGKLWKENSFVFGQE